MTRGTAVSTDRAPAPAGPYSQAVRAGDFVFLAGQTARTVDGPIPAAASPEEQCRQAIRNLDAVARAAGGALADAVKVTVFLADLAWKSVFDEVYEQEVGSEPARSTVCAAPPSGHVEVEAILYEPARSSNA